jgi:hypothetical protein
MIVRFEVAANFQVFVSGAIYYVHERCSACMSLGLMMMDPHVIYVCTTFLLLIRHVFNNAQIEEPQLFVIKIFHSLLYVMVNMARLPQCLSSQSC